MLLLKRRSTCPRGDVTGLAVAHIPLDDASDRVGDAKTRRHRGAAATVGRERALLAELGHAHGTTVESLTRPVRMDAKHLIIIDRTH